MRQPQHRLPIGSGPARRLSNSASEISSLEIVVAVRPDEEGEILARELSRTRSVVRRVWPLTAHLPETADVLFCELIADLPQCLPWVPGQPSAALVVVMPAGQTLQLELLRNCAPHAVLHRPFTGATVLTSLAIGRLQFLYEQRLRTRIDKLDETLRSFRCVERAKCILMEKRHLDEEEAYHFMRQQAMRQRVTVGAVAAVIIDSHDILG